MAGIYDFIREEYEKAKKAFGLIGGIKVENDPKARELSDFERKLYEKSLIYKSMKDAVTAPMRAYRGEFDVNSPYAVQEAMNTAGMAQLGGMPGGAKGPGSVGMSSKPKGWVSGWKTRVEQPYLEGPPAPKRPRDTWGGYDTPEEYQAAQAARQIADAEWAARTSAAWQRILNEPLPSLNGVPSQAGRARLGNAMQDVQSYANNRPRNALGQEIPPTQYELAHAEAQRVAALPVEQGGLGLPPNNTAMDRAKAMGYGRELYHATPYEFSEFKPHYYRGASFMADTPKGAWDGMLAGGGDMQFAKHDTDNLGVMLPVRVSGKVYGESIAPDWWFNDVKTYGDMRDVFSGKVPLTNPPVEGLSVSQLEELNKMRMQTAKSSPGAFKEAIPESEWGKYPLITNEYGAIDTPRDFPIIKGDIQTGAENFAPFDYKGFEGYGYDPWAHRPNLKREEVRDLLKKIGFDSAKVSDESGHATAVMNPSRIRSRFAAFNPQKRDSADILAGLAAPLTTSALLAALLAKPDEAQAK